MTKILIVDDTDAIRELAQHLLQSLGIETQVAVNGLGALIHCRAEMPDAILLDWNMPLMDGPTFHKNLRALPGGHEVKVIFCTVESDMEQMKIAMDGGAIEYIMKPFDIDILISKLQMSGLLPLSDAA